jgi:hypothetical protein
MRAILESKKWLKLSIYKILYLILNFIISMLVILMSMAVFLGLAWPATEFHQDFRGGSLDTAALKVVGSDRTMADAGGLLVRVPRGSASPQRIGVETRFKIRGDFEATATFKILEADVAREGFGLGVGMLAESDGPTRGAITVERSAVPTAGEKFTSTWIFTTSTGARVYDPVRIPAESREGRLRLTRTGPMIHVSCAEDDGPFRSLRRLDFGPQDVASLQLTADRGQSDHGLVVLLKDLRVRADELSGAPSSVRWSLPRLVRIVLLSPIVMVAFVAMVWRWRRARRSFDLGKGAPVTRPIDEVISAVGADDREGTLRLAGAPAQFSARNRRRAVLIGAALVLALATINQLRASAENPVHTDELDWTTRAYYYRLAFLDHDFGHMLWTDFDGIDQPHVTDFLIGASFHLAGQPVPEVPYASISWAHQPPPSGDRLRVARLPGTLLGSCLALLVYLIGIRATGSVGAGAIAGVFFSCHWLALQCLPMAMSDAPLLFFSTVPVFLLMWARPTDESVTPEQPLFRGPWLALLLLGPLALGLATGSKLTGIFAATAVVLAIAVYFCERGILDRGRLLESALYFYVFFCLVFVWTIAVNPTLYSNPVMQFRSMLKHRWQVAQRQQLGSPENALHSLGDRYGAVYDNVFRQNLGPGSGWALAVLSLIGLAAICEGEVRRVRAHRRLSPSLVTVIWALILMGGLAPALPLNWDRYYLPFLPCAAVLIGGGAVVSAKFLLTSGTRLRWRESSTLATTALVIAVWLQIAMSMWSAQGLFGWAGVDFAMLRSGALALASPDPSVVYDAGTITAYCRRLVMPSGHEFSASGVIRYPPALLLPLLPFAQLRPSWGFAAWSACGLIASLAVAYGLSVSRRCVHPGRVLLMALAYFPLGYGLLVGEPVALMILGLYLVYRELERGRDFRAGLCVGLLLFQPVLAVVLTLTFVLKRRWLALGGLGTAALVVAALSLVLAGTAGLRGYLDGLASSCRFSPVHPADYHDHMLNWRSLVLNVSPRKVDEESGLILIAILATATLGVLPLIWRGPWEPQGHRFAERILATLIVATLVGPYEPVHSASLLLVPGLALAADDTRPGLRPRLVRLGLYVPLILYYLTGSMQRVALGLIAMMLLALLAILLQPVMLPITAASRGSQGVDDGLQPPKAEQGLHTDKGQ